MKSCRRAKGELLHWGLPWPGPSLAADAEKAGAAAFCSGEFVDANAYVTAAEMAAESTQALIGPGIAYAFARSPFVHASAIRQLCGVAPNRVFLGLGAGTSRMNREWFGVDSSRPAERMGELIEVVRAFLHADNGDRIGFDGDFYRIDANIAAPVLGQLNVPILVGAFNRRMLRTVGRCADGVIGHGLFTDRWWRETVEPEIARGAAAAGRSLDGLRRWGWLIVAISDDDPQRAIEDAKRQIAFYLTVKSYDALVELHGWQDQTAAIRTDFRAGQVRDLGRHVTDDMLNAIAICGDSDQAREMLDRREYLPQTGFLAPPGFLVGARRRAKYTTNAITFATGLAEVHGEPQAQP